MKLLLDTHALLWWLSDDDRIGPQARALIADPGNDILVSVVSFWEIVVKMRVGKLEADIKETVNACNKSGFIVLDVRTEHLRVLATLPMHNREIGFRDDDNLGYLPLFGIDDRRPFDWPLTTRRI